MPGSIQKCLFTTFVFFLLINVSSAQFVIKTDALTSGIRITGQIGASKLLAEMPNTLSGAIYEFDNQPGLSYNFELSKHISGHLEAGIGLSVSGLKGENDSPEFSAIGIHAAMAEPINEPVIYSNNLYNQKIFIRYYFRDFSAWNKNFQFVPFVSTGIGNSIYKSELRYKNNGDRDIIFGKRSGNYVNAKVTTAVYFLGFGLKISIFSNIDLLGSLTFNAVNYDFLDVVHNYDSTGSRLELIGIYSELMFGISWRFNRSNVAKNKNNNRKTKDLHLPWYHRN